MKTAARMLSLLFQVRLSRQPTPYPKDIREKIQHFRDVAIAKQHVHRGELPQVYDNPLMLEEDEEKVCLYFYDKFLSFSAVNSPLFLVTHEGCCLKIRRGHAYVYHMNFLHLPESVS